MQKISEELTGKKTISGDFLQILTKTVKSTEEDKKLLGDVVSPVQEALAASRKALEKIQKITGGEFKEGEIFSLDPEDLD